MMKRLLLNLAMSLAAPLSCAASSLYYCGLGDNGWQIFKRDLSSGAETQITYSDGDKRFPIWSEKLGKLLYKDALGRICTVDDEGKESVLVQGSESSAHYVISHQGDVIYFTKLLANNPLRQSLWTASSGDNHEKPRLLFRMPQGSMRNLAISPDDQSIVFSHVWRDNEEQLRKMDLKGIGDSVSQGLAVTAELETCAFPKFSLDGKKIYFSKRVERGNYDLFVYDLAKKKSRRITDTSDVSEFYPIPTEDPDVILCEIRKAMNSQIARIHLETGAVEIIKTDRPAKEPCPVK